MPNAKMRRAHLARTGLGWLVPAGCIWKSVRQARSAGSGNTARTAKKAAWHWAAKPLAVHTGPLKLGETVEAIGHPKGYEFTITRGVISAVRRQRSAAIGSDNLVEFIQTDTPISPGNSGGPLLLKDAVIGVNDWIRVDKGSQSLNFSVSYNEIRSYLDRFKSK